jgi:hypothetical protein
MKSNSGGMDRVIRILVGTALVTWAIALHGPVWAYIGIVPLVTGLIGWCPAYTLLGINTCKR